MSDTNEYSYEPLDESRKDMRSGIPEPASRWRRLGARLIDSLASIAGIFLVHFAMGGKLIPLNTGNGGARDFQSYVASTSPFTNNTLPYTLAFLAVTLVIQIWFLWNRSQSIGKMALGMVIVDVQDNKKSGPENVVGKRILLNELLTWIPLVGFIYSLVDVFFIFRKDCRCLHDHLAGTRVIRVSRG